MNEVQQIILGVFIGLVAIFDFYTIARFRVNERLLNQTVRKMVEKVDHYDHVVSLLDIRINALSDWMERYEDKGENK